jgi:3-keto-disaccharide hydrolase
VLWTFQVLAGRPLVGVVEQHREDTMKTLATALFPLLVLGCHGSNNNKPATDHPEHATAPAAEPATANKNVPEDKDDDDDDERAAPAQTPPAKPGPAPEAKGAAQTMAFDSDKADTAPAGFTFGRTGQGKQGKWVVKAEAGAPSGGNVLAQVDADTTDYRFPVAIASAPSLADVRLSVRCKPVSGKVDQACGLIFRAADPDNYYLTRANALEDNVRLYHLVKGKRVQFAGWNGKVKSGVWHELRVDAKGDHFQVYFDGTPVIDATDKTFSEAGKVGLWTKADSVTYFDDLTVTAL